MRMDFAGAIAEPIGHLGLIAATIQYIGPHQKVASSVISVGYNLFS